MTLQLDLDTLPPGRLRRTLEEFVGQPLAYADLRELIRLDELIGAAGGAAPDRVLADQPVRVGNTVLYMPGLGALAYLREHVDTWFGEEPALADAFVAWVCHHGRRPDRLRAVADARAAHRAVTAWLARLSCTAEELAHATAAALDGFPVVGTVAAAGEGGAGVLALAGELAATYGGTVAGWLWDEPAQRALWLDRERANALAPSADERPGFLHAATRFRNLRRRLREQFQGDSP